MFLIKLTVEQAKNIEEHPQWKNITDDEANKDGSAGENDDEFATESESE